MPAPEIRPRPEAGWLAGAALALCVGLLAAPLALSPSYWPAEAFAAGAPAPVTVRAPRAGAELGGQTLRGGQAVVARGQLLSPEAAALVSRLRAEAPAGALAHLGAAAALVIAALAALAALRRSARGRLLRAQVVIAAAVLGCCAAAQAALLAAPLSILAMPVAALAIAAAAALDARAGLAAGLWAAIAVAALSAFDPAALVVLGASCVAPVLVLERRRPGRLRILVAGAVAGATAALAYPLVQLLATGTLPLAELARPLYSPWLAAAAAGLASGPLALGALPALRRALGEPSARRLARLDDLGHPLLVDLADKAPGSWQHTLTMVELGERAAAAIGADARLVRVGTYFHDLGKSVSPKRYPENLGAGEAAAHDAPAASAQALTAHVSEGVRLARRARLPARVVDFVASHHAGARLEGLWRTGDGRDGDAAFRYPGALPQSPETAIVAIVDAVESATRALRRPDAAALAQVVEGIVYGKLHAGQLDAAGLDRRDLRRIADALSAALWAAHGLETAPARALDALDAGAAAPLPAGPSLDSVPTEDDVEAAALASTASAAPTTGSTRAMRPNRPEIEILADDDPVAARASRDQQSAAADQARRASLDEWEGALETASSLAPPITSATPPPPPRKKRGTIPLDEEAEAGRRPESDGGIGPGVMVVGAPPATHPRPGTEDERPRRRKR